MDVNTASIDICIVPYISKHAYDCMAGYTQVSSLLASSCVPGISTNIQSLLLQRSASEKRKARRKVNQRFLTAMMDMGIPNEKAELALSETGNVGVEVATEWLFSVPDHVLEKHLASEPNTPVEATQQNSEDTRVLLPRRVPLQVQQSLDIIKHYTDLLPIQINHPGTSFALTWSPVCLAC